MDKVNAAQDRFVKNVERVTGDLRTADSPKEVARQFDVLAAEVDRTASELNRIEPPKDVVAPHEQLVEAISTFAEDVRKAGKTVQEGGQKDVVKAQGEFAADSARASTKVTNAINEINQKLQN